MTAVPEWPPFNRWFNDHNPISSYSEVNKQLVLKAKLTRNVVLKTSATVAYELDGVARHPGFRKLPIFYEIRVCHDYFPAKVV